MPYVLHDQSGKVAALFEAPDPGRGVTEELPPNDPEVVRFLGGAGMTDEAVKRLSRTDADMARVTEDLIYILIDKSVFMLTDLPSEARSKLLARRQLREQFVSLAGMIRLDEEDIP